MRHNGHREPEQIQADIERTRSELDHTLSAIEHRLTPGQLVDQGMDYLRRHGAREYMANLGEAVKRDPLPLAFVGIGLAWLMASDRGRSGEPLPSHDTTATMKERTAAMKERVARTTDKVSQAAQSARERVGQVGETARHQAERMRDGYERLVNDQPLALGAVGLAVGAVLAAAMPRTAQEERLVGAAKERLGAEPPPLQGEPTMHGEPTMASGSAGAELPPDASLVTSAPRAG